jgi:N-acetylglucosamine kinase-like BadF-type ATPase
VESPLPGDVGVDLGKTSCRIRLITAEGMIESDWSGASGFAAGTAGVEQALSAVDGALARMPSEARAGIRRIGVAAAGASANPDAASTFAEALAQRQDAAVAVVTDALGAHIGALGGRPGTVLIAGTGSIAVHVSSDGTVSRADGWGIWLGDLGSGRWIGQEALRRVLRCRDGLARDTSLTEAAVQWGGSLDALPRRVSEGGQPERVLASFAPVVLEHAEQKDEVALSIVAEAVEKLAETAAACTTADEPLAIVGGLTSSTMFRERLTAALESRGRTITPALDDAVAGALLLCVRTDLPHERSVIRVRY